MIFEVRIYDADKSSFTFEFLILSETDLFISKQYFVGVKQFINK